MNNHEKLNVPHYVKAAIYGMACTLAMEDGNRDLQYQLAQVFAVSWDMRESAKMSAFLEMVENFDK